jgi:hypothetical protein
MLCIPGDMGQLTTGSMWYRLGPGVGTWKVGGNGERMGWSGVWVEVVDGVGSGTLTGSTYIGDGGHATGTGAGGMGAGAGAGAVKGASAGAGGMGGGWKRKFEGLGSQHEGLGCTRTGA